MIRVRFDELRVPTKQERASVQARIRGMKRFVTFNQAWRLYMREEQSALDLLLRKKDEAEQEGILTALDAIQEVMGYTALKAIRVFNFEPGMQYHRDLVEDPAEAPVSMEEDESLENESEAA